ncbi:YcnI family protein [Geodermatophilus sp. YIM 151500]|uniref:YcnI family copper-binding membrane protein n=1 Tax=Geodermatophilus sp. YIM 151500 TaxID=2984531 RepID=UPI0021E5019F|nr:YcnI family protein [Geodermatophilus sp. YIM 151500]MCV2490808.1 YcnI family protein [Geodermatophilus sp. YIM 151500]
MSRSMHRTAVVLLAVLTALAASVGLAGGAAAHVTVSSADAAPGGYGKMTFRVPNESDTARTVALRVSIPEEAALASLRAQPVPGWTATMTTAQLSEPAAVHGQEIDTYVSVVEWRADEGTGIEPGQFQEFSLSGGPFPDVEQVVLPAVQTYSDGSEAAWIEPTVEGQGEPEYPAPVLALSGGTGEQDAAPAEVQEAAAPAADGEAAGDGGSGTATAALVLAVLGLLAGLGGLYLGWSARRRTVAP